MPQTTCPEVAVKLHERYGFLPHQSKESVAWMFSGDHAGETEGEFSARQLKNVALLLGFCAEHLIRFEIKSRIKDRACTSPSRNLEYKVQMCREFIPGFDLEGESDWDNSLLNSTVHALAGVLNDF